MYLLTGVKNFGVAIRASSEIKTVSSPRCHNGPPGSLEVDIDYFCVFEIHTECPYSRTPVAARVFAMYALYKINQELVLLSHPIRKRNIGISVNLARY